MFQLSKNTQGVVFVVACFFTSIASADVIVSNLAEPYRASTPIGNTPPLEFWAAQSFTTDGNAWNLDSIQAIMGSAADSPAGVFELRKDTGANEIDLTAGGLLTTFAAPSLAGANSVRDFFPAIGIQLNPNTKYWFMAGVSNDGTYEWDYANTGLYSGPGSLVEFGDSSDGGVTWDYHDSPFFPYFLQVNGSSTGVPEPAMGIVFAAGFCLVFSGRRRCRRSGTNSM